MVEGSGFENRRGGNSTRGSNPFFSAKSLKIGDSCFGLGKKPGPYGGSSNPSLQRCDCSVRFATVMFRVGALRFVSNVITQPGH